MKRDAMQHSGIFLDRDGVINLDFGYGYEPSSLEFTPTAVKGIRLFKEAGFTVVVVTNQSGVARGYFDVNAVHRFHFEMQAKLRAAGTAIDAFYFCPYHPAGTVQEFSCDHEDRKPNPGMILRAINDLKINRFTSWLIGDKASDLEAARRAGVRGILVDTNICDLAAEALKIVRLAEGGSD